MHILLYILAQTLYYIGHLISLTFRFTGGYLGYNFYQWCMLKSCELSDKYNLEIWKNPSKEGQENSN